MRSEFLRPFLLFGIAITVGWIAWSGVVLLLPVALVFPVLWSIASSRRAVVLISAGYFLAASRGLPLGVAAYYRSDLWPGLLLWLGASLSFIVVHAALWTDAPSRRPIRYLAASLLVALPPFGITGWAHPITAAGVLFPAWGWCGLAAMTVGLVALATRLRSVAAIVLSGVWLWSVVTWNDPVPPDGWKGVGLDLGSSLGRDSELRRHRDLMAIAREALQSDGTTVVLPESALGNWTPTVERLWRRGLSDVSATVIAGAVVVTEDGYDNVLVAISASRGEVLYRERMPVPGSMWQPWQMRFGQSRGARADFFANPVADLNGKRIAPLICYEQLIVWPVLQSMLHEPDVIVAVGNSWWTAGTSIVTIQHASVAAWARLFAKPLVTSFNT